MNTQIQSEAELIHENEELRDLLKKAETALNEFEERFYIVADFTYDWGYWITPDGCLKYVSPSCERITGRPPQDFIANPGLLVEIVHPDDRGQVKWHLQYDQNSPEICALEFRILTLDGQVRWIEHNCQAVKGRDGHPLGRRASNRDITVNKLAENSLRYQAALLNNMNDAVIASDPNNRITAWNSAAENMYGWKAEEVLGRNVQEVVRTIFPPLARAKMLDRIPLAGGWQGEVTQIRKDESRFSVDVASVVLRDELGRTTGYLSVNRDITQRNQFETRLLESEERFRSVLENSQDAAYRRNLLTDRYDYVSPVFEQITGWTVEEMTQADIATVLGRIYPDDLPEVDRIIEQTMQECRANGRATADLEYRFLCKNGQFRWVADRIFVLANGSGLPIFRGGTFRDIHQIKLAQTALQESERRYRSLFENMTEGFAIHDLILGPDGKPCDYRFLDVNPAFERLTRIQRADVVGQLKSVVLPNDDPFWLEIYAKVAMTGEPLRFENHSSALNRDYEGFAYRTAPLQFAVVFFEITERKKSEDNLRETTQALADSEEQYHSLFNTMLQGVVYQDANGTIKMMNPAAERILGKTKAELLGQNSVSLEYDILREDGSPLPGLEHPAMVALNSGCEVRDIIMQVYNPKEKQYRLINITAVPQFRPGETRPYQVYTVFNDITKRWLAEKQAEEGKRILDALMRYVPEGITIAEGNDARIRMVSQYGQELVGGGPYDNKTTSEVTQTWQIYAADGKTPLPYEELPLVRAVHRGEVVINQDMIRMNANGKQLYLSCNAGPIRDEAGNITGGVVAWRDITERIKSEEAIRQLNRELTQQSERLLRANNDLESFRKSVSLDLRTPLHGIESSSEILRKEFSSPLSPEAQNQLEIIAQNTKKIEGLIEELLAFPRQDC